MIKALLWTELPVSMVENPAALAIFTDQAVAMGRSLGRQIEREGMPMVQDGETPGMKLVVWNLK